MELVAWFIGGVMFMLSAIHLYWLSGGRKGAAAAIPSQGTAALFQPTRIATGVVAAALGLAGWIALELGAVERVLLPGWLYPYAGGFLAGVFLIRAIGDFRWVGFLKSRRGTLFARWDTLLYSPLCLIIGSCYLLLLM